MTKRERGPLTLYQFQEQGVEAIIRGLTDAVYTNADGMVRRGNAFLLYDEMGLGKTIQTWVALRRMKERGILTGPTLIISKASCTSVWTKGDYLEYFCDHFTLLEGVQNPRNLDCRHVVVVTYRIILDAYKYYVYNRLDAGLFTNDELIKYCKLYGKSIQHTQRLHGDDLRRELLYIARKIRKKPCNTFKTGLVEFMKQQWGCIVMDEVQKIKDPDTAHSKSVGFMSANYRLALSGTPMMNHGGDLMSVFKYGLGLLNLDWFRIKKNPEGEYCANILMNFSLGRLKKNIQELQGVLPKRQKEDEVVILPWSDNREHKQIYIETKESSLTVLREAELMRRQPGESTEAYNTRRRGLNLSFMAKMQKLRQICLHQDLPLYMASQENGTVFKQEHKIWRPEYHSGFHPWIKSRVAVLLKCLKRMHPRTYAQSRLVIVKAVIENEAENCIQPSPKMMQVLPHLREGKKLIIFSTFKVFLEHIMQPWLSQMGVKSLIFCGGPKKKQDETLEAFRNNADVQVLLLVKTAGAEGLNLQETCSVCIIMDPHFNMALDEQAAQRIDRIGQRQDVIVRRLFMEGSIDEAIRMMQEEKSATISAWLGGGGRGGGGKKSLEAHGLFLRRYDTVSL